MVIMIIMKVGDSDLTARSDKAIRIPNLKPEKVNHNQEKKARGIIGAGFSGGDLGVGRI